MGTLLVLLLLFALLVSIGIGLLAGQPARELVAQTLAMWAACLIFVGLVSLF